MSESGERSSVARLAHRVRTPIGVIGGFAELLRADDGSLTSEQRSAYAQAIVDATGELRAAVDEIEAGAGPR